jgi:hypothetical protein
MGSAEFQTRDIFFLARKLTPTDPLKAFWLWYFGIGARQNRTELGWSSTTT